MGHVIHTLKARAGIGALTFAAVAPFVSACGVTTWERVVKSMTLGAFALASALALASPPGQTLSFEPPSGSVFDFGNVVVGTTETLPFSFSWAHSSGDDYSIFSNLLTSNNPPFEVQRTSAGCFPGPGTCSYDVTFSPTALGFASHDQFFTGFFRQSFPGSRAPLLGSRPSAFFTTLPSKGLVSRFLAPSSVPDCRALYWQVVASSAGGDGDGKAPEHPAN